MGDSLPPPAAIDLVGSYARRRGSEVELVLREPKSAIAGSTVTVTLACGQRSVDAVGELIDDGDRRLVVRASRAALSDGIWTLTLHTARRASKRLDARLLVQGERPVVLLWGARTKLSVVPLRRSDEAKRRAAAAAGRTVDRALSVLPEDRARQIRSRVRSTARRVLS